MSDASRPHEHVELLRSGPTATVRIDRPEALGALSRGVLHALADLERQFAGDPALRVVVLTGTGKGFIAGADIGEYDGVSQQEFEDYQRLGRAVFDGWAALPQYTVAAVNGWALGGGFELALCCDEILAVERARFGLPEVKLGLLPGGGGSQRLARALGARFTKHLMASGAFVSASELHRRGLITTLAADIDELDRVAGELTQTIAANAPIAVRSVKGLVDEGVALPLSDAVDLEQQVLARLFRTDDAREGIAAFIEKRDPSFRDR